MANWLTINPTSGTGSTSGEVVTITPASENTGRNERSGNVTFKVNDNLKSTLRVTQEGKELFLENSISGTSIGAEGGYFSFSATTNGWGLTLDGTGQSVGASIGLYSVVDSSYTADTKVGALLYADAGGSAPSSAETKALFECTDEVAQQFIAGDTNIFVYTDESQLKTFAEAHSIMVNSGIIVDYYGMAEESIITADTSAFYQYNYYQISSGYGQTEEYIVDFPNVYVPATASTEAQSAPFEIHSYGDDPDMDVRDYTFYIERAAAYVNVNPATLTFGANDTSSKTTTVKATAGWTTTIS